MNTVRMISLSLLLGAGALAAAADQVYSSAQAVPGAQLRPVQGCVYAGQVFSRGAVLQAAPGVVLTCSLPASANAPGGRASDELPVWISMITESKAAQRPRK